MHVLLGEETTIIAQLAVPETAVNRRGHGIAADSELSECLALVWLSNMCSLSISSKYFQCLCGQGWWIESASVAVVHCLVRGDSCAHQQALSLMKEKQCGTMWAIASALLWEALLLLVTVPNAGRLLGLSGSKNAANPSSCFYVKVGNAVTRCTAGAEHGISYVCFSSLHSIKTMQLGWESVCLSTGTSLVSVLPCQVPWLGCN